MAFSPLLKPKPNCLPLLRTRSQSKWSRTEVMSKEELEAFFSPPSSVCGATSLDRSLFKRSIPLPAIRLQDASLCTKFIQHFSHVMLKYPFVKRIVDVPDEAGKLSKALLLIPEELRPHPLTIADHEWIEANGGEETTQAVSLTYPDSYSQVAIMKALLPAAVKEVPSGFEVVGHIAHLNLKEELMPYKNLIGQVVLDKHKLIRTVVNKTDQIDNTFRFFSMEVLAGENDLVATIAENGCTFSFDFSKVYWNSRLHSEHQRIVNLVKTSDIILDVFAGVGPFAIPVAKKGCIVHANDLNPNSYEYLCKNAKKNGVKDKIRAYNLDGKEFIYKVTSKYIDAYLGLADDERYKMYTHVLMNLPATAVEFLNTFKGLFCRIPESRRSTFTLPTVHCYCFSKSEESPELDSLSMVAAKLGVASLGGNTYSVSVVRKVAPNKTMTRVSFQLPSEVAYTGGSAGNHDGRTGELNEPSPKRTKLE